MNRSWYISRRTALRSAGVSLALPFLDVMLKPGARAAAASPKRFVGIFGLVCGVVAKRDPVQNCRVAPWTPAGTGSILDLAPDKYLKPFYDNGLQSKLTLLTGLSDRQTGHHNCSELLASVCNLEDNPMKGLTGIGGGPSADQVIANEVKRLNPTLVPSLALSAGPVEGGNGPFRKYISWTATQPIPLERNPRLAFETLFGASAAATPATPEAKAEAMRRQVYDLSILDSVRGEATSLTGKLGRSDRRKLDEYLTGIRELEEKMKRAGAPAPITGCTPGAVPAAQTAEYLKDNANLDMRVKLMMDVMVKAFECDRTRVMSFMYTNAYGLNGYPHLGLATQNHHVISHYASNSPLGLEKSIEWMDKVTIWVFERYAYLMKELDRRVEADGSTVLDNSVIYLSGEHCDSSGHTSGSMPIVLGGRGGKDASGGWAVKTGRHVRYPPFQGGKETLPRGVSPTPERSVRDLLWGIIKLMGVNLPTYGEATKPIDLSWVDAVGS